MEPCDQCGNQLTPQPPPASHGFTEEFLNPVNGEQTGPKEDLQSILRAPPCPAPDKALANPNCNRNDLLLEDPCDQNTRLDIYRNDGKIHLPVIKAFVRYFITVCKDERLLASNGTKGKKQEQQEKWSFERNKQVEAGSLAFINPDVQELLEILITKRVELKFWKEKEEEEEAGYHLNSSGKRIESLGYKQDTLGHQHFWNIKGKREQLLGPEKPRYPDTLGDCLQKTCSQLFWGLPFLHKSLSYQILSSGDKSNSQKLYDATSSEGSSQGQQVDMRRQLKYKSQGKKSVPKDGREKYTRPKLRQIQKGLAERRAYQPQGMSHPGQRKESTESLKSKFRHLILKKRPVPSESYFKERIKLLLQWIFPNKCKEPEEPLQKGKLETVSVKSQESIKSKSTMDSRAVEAQTVITAVGQILKEKMVFHHGPHATELNWYQAEFQDPIGPHYCHHRILSYQEQRRMRRDTPRYHQATPMCHSFSNKASEKSYLVAKHPRYRSKVLSRWLAGLPLQLAHLGSRNPELSTQLIDIIHTAAARANKELLRSLQVTALRIYVCHNLLVVPVRSQSFDVLQTAISKHLVGLTVIPDSTAGCVLGVICKLLDHTCVLSETLLLFLASCCYSLLYFLLTLEKGEAERLRKRNAALAFTEENGCCAEIVQKKEPKTLKCARSPELILGSKMQQPHEGSSDA
ncbi:hypothetical protein MG293_007676 [Ovis ammon polii]|uniref:Uncharacterized protein n=1 Tax=Ovis ammon polii TaxID=230172 RepID=A0AAD4U951_OVIAM|nr:hypothetical protein MG293_007676 [Ovis ammon polii]KAI4573609.1 hypothetical protein MJT46_004849 [Ovis ammon polii x Ovis aries]